MEEVGHHDCSRLEELRKVAGSLVAYHTGCVKDYRRPLVREVRCGDIAVQEAHHKVMARAVHHKGTAQEVHHTAIE